jgi:hypothetical protein
VPRDLSLYAYSCNDLEWIDVKPLCFSCNKALPRIIGLNRNHYARHCNWSMLSIVTVQFMVGCTHFMYWCGGRLRQGWCNNILHISVHSMTDDGTSWSQYKICVNRNYYKQPQWVQHQLWNIQIVTSSLHPRSWVLSIHCGRYFHMENHDLSSMPQLMLQYLVTISWFSCNI